tara:strand:+ start:2633 stop:2875 length:243 start_codon:yes stop_codon:yes gene_type:complete
MKILKNTSMQGLNIPVKTDEGVENFFLAPGKSIEIPDTWRSKIANTLVERRMLKIRHVPDAAVPAPLPPVKALKKPRKSK